MNTLANKVYERLRKRSLRATKGYPPKTAFEFLDDYRRVVHPDRTWDDELHAAYVAGLKDGLDELEEDIRGLPRSLRA